jgi:hypothetical protein
LVAGYAKLLPITIIIVLGALITSLFIIIPSLTGVTNQIQGSNDGKEDLRRIVVFDKFSTENDSGVVFRYLKIDDGTAYRMEPNSKKWFLDPFGSSMRTFYERNLNSTIASHEEIQAFLERVDAQEQYQIIRLPEWLGGYRSEISVFRAYSAFDIASHCLVTYWPNEGRMDIEDPCHSNRYRVWDGLAYVGMSSFGGSGGQGLSFTSDYLALPQMRLGIDAEGYIVASKPDNSLYGDGVVGEGRRLTSEQLKESNLKLIAAGDLALGVQQQITIPAEVLPGNNLIWLSPANVRTDFGYGTSLGTEEDSSLVVAAYRQRGSQQYYDYSLTVVALSNTSRLALTDSEDYGVRALEIFDSSVSQFECYEPLECSYETKSGDNLAGEYAIIKVQQVTDPTRNDSYRVQTYGRALVWKTPQLAQENETQYLIVVNAVDENMESILRAIRSV